MSSGRDRSGDPIVVGVSPTTGSPVALRWAAREAAVHGVRLRAVLAWRAPRPPAAPAGRPPTTMVRPPEPDPADAAQRRLRRFVEVALGDGVTGAPVTGARPSAGSETRNGAEVECRAIEGGAVSVLLKASADAQLLIIGESRPGRAGSVRTSLVAPRLIRKGSCPVVILPSAGAGLLEVAKEMDNGAH